MPAEELRLTASSYFFAGGHRNNKSGRDRVAGRKCLFQRLVQKLFLFLPCIFSRRFDRTFLFARSRRRPSGNIGLRFHLIFSTYHVCFSAHFTERRANSSERSSKSPSHARTPHLRLAPPSFDEEPVHAQARRTSLVLFPDNMNLQQITTHAWLQFNSTEALRWR